MELDACNSFDEHQHRSEQGILYTTDIHALESNRYQDQQL
jgi:hypothetical protein